MLDQYTNQLLVGEDGEALISLRAGEMRHVCHRRPGPDADIDGQLELRAPEIQGATSELLPVQRADARPVRAGVPHPSETMGVTEAADGLVDPKQANDMRITCPAESR